MKFLDKPAFTESGEEIFEKCVKKYTLSPLKRKRLRDCKPLVRQDTKRYRKMVRKGARFDKPVLPNGMEAKGLHCVYDEKFANKKIDIRAKYYDKIMEQVENMSCPICGENGSFDMDHFLPKSQYPTLCVFPSNLVPICSTCNKIKGEKCRINQTGEPVHLYFDRIPTEKVNGKERHRLYLYVNLGAEFEAAYYVKCPQEWNRVLRRRLRDQMDVYELYRRFAEFAVIEMGNLETQWRQDLKNQRDLLMEYGISADDIDIPDLWRRAIKTTLETELELDPNSWKAAFCRALYDDVGRLVAWLQKRVDAEAQSNT